eukprot:g2543.t1
MNIGDLQSKRERCSYLLQDTSSKVTEGKRFVQHGNFQLASSSRLHAEQNLRDVETLLQQLSRQSRGFTKRDRQAIKQFITKSKEDVKFLKREIQQIAQDELLGGGSANDGTQQGAAYTSDRKARLVNSTNTLVDTGSSLDRTRRLVADTEDIGVN